MISVWTANLQFENAHFIPKDVWQHVEIATDLDMDFHVQPHKANVRSHAPTAISHSPIWTASITIRLSKCRDNNANSRVSVNSATTENYAGR